MKIALHDLTIRDLVAGYRDDGEGGKSESDELADTSSLRYISCRQKGSR